MNPFSLRVLSSLVNATPRQYETILADRASEVPHGFLSYQGAYGPLRLNMSCPEKAIATLQQWRDNDKLRPSTRSFRRNCYPKLEWCAKTVLPQTVRVIANLEGDRQKDGKLLKLAGEVYTGGFHALVEWDDGSMRLVYLLGPEWTRKRIRHMLALLQMKAITVYRLPPQSVVMADMHRREVIQKQSLNEDAAMAVQVTAKWLHEHIRGRKAS